MTGDHRRWQMTEAPALAPAVDYFTRTPNGPFIDTGVEVNFGMKGHIYISIETLREMAEIAGLLGDTRDPEAKNLHEMAIYNRGLKDGIARGEELHGQLRDVLAHLGEPPAGDPDLGGVDDAPAGAAPGPEPEGDGGSDGAPVGGGEPGGAPDDDARGEGADGVSGDGGDDNDRFRI